MKRCEQKIEDTWNMQDMYENEELMAQDVEKLRELMKEFASRQNSLAKSGEQLLRALKLQEEMNCLYEKLHVYANQKYHEDTAEAKYQRLSGEMQILGTELSGCTAWLEPELLAPGKSEKIVDVKRCVSTKKSQKTHINLHGRICLCVRCAPGSSKIFQAPVSPISQPETLISAIRSSVIMILKAAPISAAIPRGIFSALR